MQSNCFGYELCWGLTSKLMVSSLLLMHIYIYPYIKHIPYVGNKNYDVGKIGKFGNIMPFTNVLSANYFLLYSVVASYTCSSFEYFIPPKFSYAQYMLSILKVLIVSHFKSELYIQYIMALRIAHTNHATTEAMPSYFTTYSFDYCITINKCCSV